MATQATQFVKADSGVYLPCEEGTYRNPFPDRHQTIYRCVGCGEPVCPKHQNVHEC